LINVTLQLRYNTGIPSANAATAATTTKTVFEYMGAVDWIVASQDVADSRWKIGDSAAFGNPVLSASNVFNPSSSSSYTNGACYETYLSISNPAYQQVIDTVGSGNIHPRPGSLAGKGALECYYTLVFPEGQIVLQGLVERDFTSVSTLSIAGGTGAYLHAKGTADRSYVNPANCVNNAFQDLSVTSSCIARHQLKIIQPNNPPATNNFWWIECGGGNVGVLETEQASSHWGLGNYMPFGCPLYSSTLSNLGEIPTTPTGGRVGYDGGDCNKAYLDKRFDANPLASTRNDPGFHYLPIPKKFDGYWECPWSSIIKPDGSQLLVQGPFPDTVFSDATFAILGGTGQYFGATGQLLDHLTNPENCIAFGFLELSPSCACQYNKTVHVLV
jgi:hypothetical protein